MCHGPRVAGQSEATGRDWLTGPRWMGVHHWDTQRRQGRREVSPVNCGNDFYTFPEPRNMNERAALPRGKS